MEPSLNFLFNSLFIFVKFCTFVSNSNSLQNKAFGVKKIWLSIHPRKFGYDVSVGPNADRTDSRGGRGSQESARGGEVR